MMLARRLGLSRRVAAAPRRALGLAAARLANAKDLAALPEVVQRAQLGAMLGAPEALPRRPVGEVTLDDDACRRLLDAGLATFLLHVEARVAAYCGEGFYTIGPCGEELAGAVGLALEPGDGSALHYRHLATQLTRALETEALDDVLLARARGYCVSVSDPVTGGAHCCLGGGPDDFVVTSTLASQAPAAVGRALAKTFRAPGAGPAKKTIQYVSVGDGSVNNAHFLAAANLAEYAAHRGNRCGVVFGVTDNDRCISLRGYGWLEKFVTQRLGGTKLFSADGRDAHAVYKASRDAVGYARRRQKPAILVLSHVPRRFGHAATDRQSAYLSAGEIEAAANADPLAAFCADLIDRGVLTADEVKARFDAIALGVERAFDAASAEPKLDSRADMVSRNAAPPAAVPDAAVAWRGAPPREGRGDVFRKHATRVFDEILNAHADVVYVGEDVEHGGYYLVTEGLRKKHGHRVRDFPPDETTLLGAAVGLAQSGFVPVVEIPYAKYLDCGADVFYELAIAHWLSNGARPNGMVIRLQGFDRGLFGGNFHTHNELRMPPGVDVVCYSNGADYARGMRHAVRQARAGRVVMSVDSTYLLNLRHVDDGARDNGWVTPFTPPGDELPFGAAPVYADPKSTDRRVAVVTYGTGVLAALRARALDVSGAALDVIDAPYLNAPSPEVRDAIAAYDAVVFADPCKAGQNPLASWVCALNDVGELPRRWRAVAAPPAYNPLGRDFTFLEPHDVATAATALLADA